MGELSSECETERARTLKKSFFLIFLFKNTGPDSLRAARSYCFKNIFAKEYSEVNVEQLNRFEDNAVVDPVALVEAGILKNVLDGVRVLGSGELSKALTVRAQGFTKGAQQKIEAAGGKVEVI